MTSRLGSAFSSCAIKSQSETVEVITADTDITEDNSKDQMSDSSNTVAGSQAEPSFLWRVSSGAIGGVYNVATGAAGMGYNGTKWVLGKGVEIGSSVAEKSKDVSGNVMSKTAEVGTSIVSNIPVPSKFKAKDKKE